MAMGTLGKKVGMTQRFNEEGQIVPVTVIEVAPNPIVQMKTDETDGYYAVQIGYGRRKKNRTNKPRAGHFAKAGVDATQRLVELRLTEKEMEGLEPGATVSIDMFEAGDKVDVTGTSKGKGFAGFMKKYNFHGKSATHGTHEQFRHGGAIGMCATPSRLMKGKKMPGRMGGVRTTTQNLQVVEVKTDQNLIYIRGAVPGARNGMVLIRKAVKTRTPKKS